MLVIDTVGRVRTVADPLEDLVALTQPQPAHPIRYEWVDDPNGERLESRAPTRRGTLSGLEHLRELMLAMVPDSFLILEPAKGGWWAQTWRDPEGWVVEMALVRPDGNEVRTFTDAPGLTHTLFSFATAYVMLCDVILRQEVPGQPYRTQFF